MRSDVSVIAERHLFKLLFRCNCGKGDGSSVSGRKHRTVWSEKYESETSEWHINLAKNLLTSEGTSLCSFGPPLKTSKVSTEFLEL
jgi:hypothetical protein